MDYLPVELVAGVWVDYLADELVYSYDKRMAALLVDYLAAKTAVVRVQLTGKDLG